VQFRGQSSRKRLLEGEATKRPVEPFGEAQCLRALQQGQRVTEFCTGLTAAGGLVSDDRIGAVAGELMDGLEVRAQPLRLGDQFFDDRPMGALTHNLVGEAHVLPFDTSDLDLEPDLRLSNA
jgi:hypothetical protein